MTPPCSAERPPAIPARHAPCSRIRGVRTEPNNLPVEQFRSFYVLACDYDGTLARDGRIAPATRDALVRARDAGLRLLLITGRELADLVRVCAELTLFDLVVAENGAVLFEPRQERHELLANPPSVAFLGELTQLGVPFSAGHVIVSTVLPYAARLLTAIHSLGLEMQIIFNRDSVMALPGGVSKASGLVLALGRLGMSRHNTVGVGDAENDHAFLAQVGLAVAVGDAVPALKTIADWVTAAPDGAGVRELITVLIDDDLASVRARIPPSTVSVGTTTDGTPVTVPLFGTHLLVTGS